ncbi:MAG: ABC transporter permease [Muribaculaceae bacterium]|nr:ABC transporter permease [Muribaculaceae bacterium]
MKRKYNILRWPVHTLKACVNELKLVMGDVGVLVFFVLVSIAYPILYSLIYNTEMAHDVRVVVVDDDRSAESREFVRALDATSEVKVIGYAANMQEARTQMCEHNCYGIINLPRDYALCLGRGEQAHVNIYCDMSVMLRYRQILMSTTAVQLTLSSHIQKAKASVIPINIGGGTIDNEQVALGNTAMGLGSAVLPCILVLVLQQSMILGVGMLHGGARDRRRRFGGIDPEEYDAVALVSVVGRALAHLLVYAVPAVYALLVVPKFFDFPQNGPIIDIVAMALPYLIACSFMSQTFKIFVRGRESTFITMVFTSIIFVFLSGISWPRSSMSQLWITLGNMVPSTWASQGYIAMQSNGASLAAQSHAYMMLWVLCGFYLVSAVLIEAFVARKQTRNPRKRQY